MLEQALKSKLSINIENAKCALETAREAHERYLIKLQEHDLETAIENYITAIKLDPTVPEGYYRLASLMWENGQIGIQSAIEQCRTAISLEPKNINAHIYAGYFLKKAQDFDGAEKAFKEAIKLGGINSSRPRLILSLSILDRMNAERFTIPQFARCLYYLFTGSVSIFWDSASIKMLYKNFNESFSMLFYKTCGEIVENFKPEHAISIYKSALNKTEREEYFCHKIGDILIKDKNADEAIEYYRRAYEANPSNRDVLVKLATVNQTYFPENVDETIDYFNKLLEIEEDTAPIYYELGHLYVKKQDKINAISAFKLAVEQEPENPFYNNSLAYAFVQAELYDDAIEYYQKAIKLNPDTEWTSIVCEALGSIYYQIKENYEAAIASYQAGSVLDPNNSEIFLSLGDVYMSDNDLDNAIRAYCDSINIKSDDYRAFAKLGIALWEKDYLEEAIVAYNKAIDLNPEYDVAQNNLGVIYLDGLGDTQEALKYFNSAIALNPNYTLAYFNAGRCEQVLGNKKEAAENYQMAIDLNKLTNELDENEIKDRLYGLFNA